jgi:hypothetical protein
MEAVRFEGWEFNADNLRLFLTRRSVRELGRVVDRRSYRKSRQMRWFLGFMGWARDERRC